MLKLVTKADQRLRDACRVLRAPGFYYLKEGQQPHLCKLINVSGARYTPEQLWQHIPQQITSVQVNHQRHKVRGNVKGTYSPEDILNLLEAYPGWFKRLTMEEQKEFLDEKVTKRLGETKSGRKCTTLSVAASLGKRLARMVTTKTGKIDNKANLALALKTLKDALLKAYDGDVERAEAAMIHEGFRGLYWGLEKELAGHCYSLQDDKLEIYDYEPEAETFESRFILAEQYQHPERVVLLQSPQGTGKSLSCRGALDEFRLANPDKKVLAIGHRVELLKQNAKDLKLDFYQNMGEAELNRSRGLVITIDSLWKLDKEQWEGALVIIDEIDQALYHHTASTEVAKHRREMRLNWGWILRTSHQIWGMSADMPDLVDKHLKMVMGVETTIKRLKNTYKGVKRRYFEKGSEGGLIVELIAQIEKGHNCYVACNHKEKAHLLARRMEARFPHLNIVLVTADTKDTNDKAKRFLVDPNNNLPQLLIATPTLGTGFDISVKGHFHTSFMFMPAKSTESGWDMLQHAARVRHLITNEIFVYCHKNGDRNLPLSAGKIYGIIWEQDEDIQEIIEIGIDKAPKSVQELVQDTFWFRQLITRHPEGGYILSNDGFEAQYLQDYVRLNLRRNASLLCPQRHLIKLLEARGQEWVPEAEGTEKPKSEPVERSEDLYSVFRGYLKAKPFDSVEEMEQVVFEAKRNKAFNQEIQARVLKTKLCQLTGYSDAEIKQRSRAQNPSLANVAFAFVLEAFAKFELYSQLALWSYTYIYDENHLKWLDTTEIFDTQVMAPDRKKRTAKANLIKTLVPPYVMDGGEIGETAKKELAKVFKANKSKAEKVLGIKLIADDKKVIQNLNRVLGLMGLRVDKLGQDSASGERIYAMTVGLEIIKMYRDFCNRTNRGQLPQDFAQKAEEKIWNTRQAEFAHRLVKQQEAA